MEIRSYGCIRLGTIDLLSVSFFIENISPDGVVAFVYGSMELTGVNTFQHNYGLSLRASYSRHCKDYTVIASIYRW